jgi:hypothetical protein
MRRFLHRVREATLDGLALLRGILLLVAGWNIAFFVTGLLFLILAHPLIAVQVIWFMATSADTHHSGGGDPDDYSPDEYHIFLRLMLIAGCLLAAKPLPRFLKRRMNDRIADFLEALVPSWSGFWDIFRSSEPGQPSATEGTETDEKPPAEAAGR